MQMKKCRNDKITVSVSCATRGNKRRPAAFWAVVRRRFVYK